MEKSSEIIIDTKSKSSRKKYIIAAVIIFLFILSGLIYRVITWEPKPDPTSEAKIRKIVARQLNKDPNELTDQDFEKITTLNIGDRFGGSMPIQQELSDIALLKKFINLQSLQICYIYCPENKIPKWMEILAKFGLYDLNKQTVIDLSPLERLTRLERLEVVDTPIKDFKPIAKLTNLQHLEFRGVLVGHFEHVKKLTKLKSLSFVARNTSDLKAIEGLTNLERLTITAFKIYSIEPIKELINLKNLQIENSSITDLEPVKGLKNLESLLIFNCTNITEEQIQDLQKTLPNLYIWRI